MILSPTIFSPSESSITIFGTSGSPCDPKSSSLQLESPQVLPVGLDISPSLHTLSPPFAGDRASVSTQELLNFELDGSFEALDDAIAEIGNDLDTDPLESTPFDHFSLDEQLGEHPAEAHHSGATPKPTERVLGGLICSDRATTNKARSFSDDLTAALGDFDAVIGLHQATEHHTSPLTSPKRTPGTSTCSPSRATSSTALPHPVRHLLAAAPGGGSVAHRTTATLDEDAETGNPDTFYSQLDQLHQDLGCASIDVDVDAPAPKASRPTYATPSAADRAPGTSENTGDKFWERLGFSFDCVKNLEFWQIKQAQIELQRALERKAREELHERQRFRQVAGAHAAKMRSDANKKGRAAQRGSTSASTSGPSRSLAESGSKAGAARPRKRKSPAKKQLRVTKWTRERRGELRACLWELRFYNGAITELSRRYNIPIRTLRRYKLKSLHPEAHPMANQNSAVTFGPPRPGEDVPLPPREVCNFHHGFSWHAYEIDDANEAESGASLN